jgi:hypothetical protein
VVVGSLALAANCYDVALWLDIAYIAADTLGVRVVDVSNPASPVEIAHYNTPGHAHALAVDGNIAYVADFDYFGAYECTNLHAIHVAIPNGGELWETAETYWMTWESVFVEGNLNIYANCDYPAGTWELIGADLPNTGSAQWTIAPPITDCARIKIESVNDPSIFDISNGDFQIRRGTMWLHPCTLDFGEVAPNTSALDTFWIVSHGADSVVVDSVICASGYFGANTIQTVVASGDSVAVPVWFTPFEAAHYDGELTVYSSAGDSTVTLVGDGLSGTGAGAAMLPRDYVLQTPYPNPFNATTTLRFALPKPGHVAMRAYDLLGRQAALIVEGNFDAGWHEQSWNCEGCASGVYVIVLTTADAHLTQKAVMVK